MQISRSSTSAPFVGLIIAFIGLAFFFFMGLKTTVSCDRISSQQVDCQVLTSLGRQIFSMEREIHQVIQANVGANCEQDCTYRVDLKTAQGIEPLTISYTNGLTHNASAAEKINRFIQNSSAQDLVFTLNGKDNIGLFAVLPFVFTGAGLVILFSSFAHQE